MSDDGIFEIETPELSRAGRVRRDRMLVELQAAMVTHRRRRKVLRATAVATAAALLAAVAWWALAPVAPREVAPAPVAASPAEELPRFEHIEIERVATDPAVLQRFACEPTPSHIERLDEHELNH